MAYFKIHVDNFEKGDLGEDVKKGDLLYLGSDGKYYKSSASDKERSTTELKIAESDGGFLDTDVKLLAYGEFTYTDFPLVPGDKYYVSYEDGKITNVLYDSEDVDYVVRYVGTAIDENKLLFNPDQTYISDNRTRVNDIPIKADFDLDDRYVSHVNSQNLPEANKSLARENIGAIPASYVKDGKLTIESSGGLVNNNIIFSANQEEDSYISLDLSEGIKSDISEGTEAFSWGDHSLEGYLKEIDLDGYATEDWVNNNFISNTHVVNSITAGDISNWDEAYSKTHVHANKSTLDSILQVDLDNWNEAYSKAHTHANKAILDGISSSDIEDWEEAYDKKVNAISFTGDTNKTLTVTREDGSILTASFLDNNDPQFPDDVLNTLTFNDNNDGVLRAITSEGSIIDVSLDGRYSLLGHKHVWEDITDRPTSLSEFTNDLGNYGNWITKAQGDTYYSAIGHTHSWGQITGKPSTFTPSSHTHNADDINAGVLAVARIPTGTSGSTVALGNHTHTWEQIENKPTNLETYGISDAVTLDNTGNKIGNYSASNIDGLDDLRTVVTYRGGNVLSMRRSSSYGGQFRNATAGNNWAGRTLSNGVWSDWNRFWHDGDFSSNTISNWNQAYDWGDFREFGLGKHVTVDESDLNNYGSTGFYRFNSTERNRPFDFGTLYHVRRSDNEATQLAIPVQSSSVRAMRYRGSIGGEFWDWRTLWDENNLNSLNQIEPKRVNYKSAQFASIDAARLTFKFRKAVEGAYINRIALSFSIAPNGYNTNDENNAVLVLKATIRTDPSALTITRYHTLSNYSTGSSGNYAWQDNTHIYVVAYMRRTYSGGFINYSGTTEITYEDSYPYDPTEVPSNAASEVNEMFATRNWVNNQGFIKTAQAPLTNSTTNTISGTQVRRAALTGDVTAAANSNETTIANNAVTTAKIENSAVTHAKYQNIATQRILGRGAAGTGNVQELTLGTGLTLSTAGVLSASGGSSTDTLDDVNQRGNETTKEIIVKQPGNGDWATHVTDYGVWFHHQEVQVSGIGGTIDGNGDGWLQFNRGGYLAASMVPETPTSAGMQFLTRASGSDALNSGDFVTLKQARSLIPEIVDPEDEVPPPLSFVEYYRPQVIVNKRNGALYQLPSDEYGVELGEFIGITVTFIAHSSFRLAGPLVLKDGSTSSEIQLDQGLSITVIANNDGWYEI